MAVSKTQIDRLGDRLKAGSHTENDFRLLDQYRQSFAVAYEAVVRVVHQHGKLPTGRLAKSTASIVEKLRRESIRLSQIQDVAGCRVVVADVLEQDEFVATLRNDFPQASVIDRRDKPSHDYRAVHVVVESFGKTIEVQVRSSLQQLWAELSEKSSDVLDSTIKYGGGTVQWRGVLTDSSKLVATHELRERKSSAYVAALNVANLAHKRLQKAVAQQLEHELPDNQRQELLRELDESILKVERDQQDVEEERREVRRSGKVIADLLTVVIALLDKIKEQNQ